MVIGVQNETDTVEPVPVASITTAGSFPGASFRGRPAKSEPLSSALNGMVAVRRRGWGDGVRAAGEDGRADVQRASG